ncbi:MAG: flagellar motor switch protein FliM [Planctomycetes bacterium]|nr:flagellar motor switch protein FliM [Planctomycetota bacterium]
MAEVLSQTEVESLLAALDPDSSLSKAQSIEKNAKHANDVAVSLYDFKRPERVSKEQIRAFQSLHDGFSREFGAELSGMLRTIVEVKLISVDQLTYSEFVFSLENPTCCNVISSGGLDGNIILDLNLSILFPIVDRLLGGDKDRQQEFPSRGLTEIELRLVSRIISRAMAGLEHAWANVCKLDLEVTRVENNPQLVQIVPPNEVVVLISFELTMGEIRGMMNLCIPFNAIEPLSATLTSESWSAYSKRTTNPRQKINLELGLSSASVEMVVILARSKLTAAEVTTLGIGDVIMTEHQIKSGVQVMVQDRLMFDGHVGMLHGHKAVRIASRVSQSHDVIDKRLAELQNADAAAEEANA